VLQRQRRLCRLLGGLHGAVPGGGPGVPQQGCRALAATIGEAVSMQRADDRITILLGSDLEKRQCAGMTLTLVGEQELRVIYRGAGMFCYLVTGFRRHANVPWARLFMPTTPDGPLASLEFKTLPWDEGLTIVAGVGEMSGQQTLTLLDSIYHEYRFFGPVEEIISHGWKSWRRSQLKEGCLAPGQTRVIEAGLAASVEQGGAEREALAVIITPSCQQQWARDAAAEAQRAGPPAAAGGGSGSGPEQKPASD